MTGGGSGGHITPILAVARELKRLQPDAEIIYIGQQGDALADIPAADPHIDTVYSVPAGKLRRYAGEGWHQLLDVHSQLLNIRDIGRTIAGIWQSFWLLRRLRPDVIFTRGGFVSVPVALGGHLNRIPYITHDSDSTPSLANRLIARWANRHAVALPKELYPYPQDKTTVVGVPINAEYKPVDVKLQASYRESLDIAKDAKVVLVTGGGNGARVLNQAVIENVRYLLGAFPDLVLLHITGRALEQETQAGYDALGLPPEARERVRTIGFVSDLFRYSGAADVVIARGGATNLAEFAAQERVCLIVPSKQLGWNVKNAQTLADEQAIEQLNEDQIEQPERLGRAIGTLLTDTTRREQLAKKLATYARPHAAADLAGLLIEVAAEGGKAHVAAKK